MQPALSNQMFGRYELLTLLARGGMAEVFLARMSGVGGFTKLLVIKRILPHLMGDPEFVEMFLNEGRIAARLNHPNVCQVHELGEVEGDMYLAMEYLEGLAWGDVVDLVPRGDGFALRCAAGVVGQICEGLRYAHELRDVDGTPTPVVHRDVSPQNLFITTSGVCKLLDFGVSKVLTEGTRTRTGMLKGKLPYMAPEQIRGEPVDPRADVFSMGIVLWESLTGDRLFKRDSDYLIWRAITEDEIPLVTARQPTLPRAIDALVGRALERDPARRHPSIAAFASELRQVAEQVGGPLDQPALAELLRSLGGPQLTERMQRVGHALGRPIREREVPASAAFRPPLATTLTDPVPVDEPSDTKHSIALRDEAVRLGRRRRTWPWLVAGAATMIAAGILAGVWSMRGGSPGTGSHDAGIVEAPADANGLVAAARHDAQPAPDEPGPDEADLVELEPAPNDAGVRRRSSTPRATRRATSAGSADVTPGLYSVDSRPYATIYVDGKSFGDTPLFKIPLAPGKHRIRAMRADGKVQHHTITIEPGKLFSSGTLTW